MDKRKIKERLDKEVQSDIKKLINYSVDFAETLLHDSGEFYPFGAKVTSTGEFKPVGFYGGDEFPESHKVAEGLLAMLEEELKDKKIRCFCISFDVRVTNEDYPLSVDAILIRFRHHDGERKLNYYYPYKLEEDLTLVFMEPWAEKE